MSAFRALLGTIRSARPANIPTLFTNAGVAWCALCGNELPSVTNYLTIVVTGLCFYLYGMWENDRVDARWDAVYAPNRPIPKGETTIGILRLCSMLVGLGALLLSLFNGANMLYALLLIVCIALYSMIHKIRREAVVLMGLCRGLWVLLAGSLVLSLSGTTLSEIGDSHLWIYAGGLTVYTMVISCLARSESNNELIGKIVGFLLSGMCLFDAIWLYFFNGKFCIFAIVMWAIAKCLQSLGVRST